MLSNKSKVKGNGKLSHVNILSVPEPEVIERPRRKHYPTEYKLKILQEADRLKNSGELGALLRREGLYSSHIAMWTWQREKGEFEGLSPKKRGPKEKSSEDLEKRIRELERDNKKLKRRLVHAEMIIDVQKKISELSGIPLKKVDYDEED
jgi:transposase-like protein